MNKDLLGVVHQIKDTEGDLINEVGDLRMARVQAIPEGLEIEESKDELKGILKMGKDSKHSKDFTFDKA